jgi:sugar O-acyltransferase (sialic acid O-acetyltransferase NeuD family)
MENKEIYILGVGRNTIVYIDLVEACGYKVAGLYHYNDERTGELIHGHKIVDSNNNLFNKDSLAGINFAISVGNNKIRTELANDIRRLGGNLPTLIHPSAIVSKYSQLAKGVVIHANSVIQADAMIEQNTIVSYNVSVTHTCRIGKNSYLAANANIGAFLEIQDNVLIGQSSVIVSGKLDYVGHDSIVGAGSVVIQNIEPYSVVAGNPAKLIKKIF